MPDDFPVDLAWCKEVPPRICFFLWGLCWNRLATREVLICRGMGVEPNCVMCSNEMGESRDHLFLHCITARDLWLCFVQAFGFDWVAPRTVVDLLAFWQSREYSSGLRELIWRLAPLAICWTLWKERNNRSFNNKT